MGRPAGRATGIRSDLPDAAVDEQLDARDETGVVGSKKHCRLGDFVRIANPAHRNLGSEMVEHALLLCRLGPSQPNQTWRLDGAGAERVDTDVAALEIEYPVAGESADRRLGGSTDAECLSAATSGRMVTVC
jgi:hypothetical protein